MASAAPGGGARGRRKQAKPQRKVELEDNNGVQYNTVLTEIAATASSMCPDTNHNEIQIDDIDDMLKEVSNTKGAAPQHAAHPDRSAKTGGTAEDIENVAAEAAVADTTNYPETVPSLTNGVKSEGDDATNAAAAEYLIKCPHCQRGCQSFQALKEHMGAEHPDLCTEGGGGGAAATLAAPGGALSPAPSTGGPYGCSQCTASFTSKDQLEKHELLHSPNAQVSCKVCNKTFANVYRLQRHMISHDESAVLRKFKCTECDKAFKFKHHLKEHIRIHSGEKPFECVNCGKRFSHSGSYSSHMTSKKCLVMNLKLGRTRAPNAAAANAMLDKAQPQQQQQSARGAKRPSNPLNNNITTTNHNAAYLPILPKYTEAAAAFIQNSLAGNPAMHSLYTHGMLNTNMHPYGVPSISHLLQQLHGGGGEKPHDYEPKVEPHELNKSCGSSCGDLVMDEGEEGKCSDVEEKEEARSPSPPSSVGGGNNNGDFEAVKRILETVNASVTKQFLQANMQKFSTENSMDCASPPRSPSPPVNCLACKKSFGTQAAFDEHDCEQNDLKSEGLAAKLEDAVASKSENEMNASGNEDEYEKGDRHEEYDKSDRAEDYDMDSESVTTTDQLTEDGRKVRVRSLISDEQLKILKDNYALNPRPKKDELTKIAEQIGFPVRVVQVWFQNTRARDRREGRLIQNSYPPPAMLPPFPIVAPVPVPSNPHYSNSKYVEYGAEQPLDLSIKKEHSRESSPASSPRRPASSNHHHSDSGDEVVNLSYKSSRSPTPLQYTPSYHHNYQESNCSSEPRISPSPLECSRLAQILATPKIHGMGLIQFGQHHHHHPDLNSLTQFIQNRMSTLSPNSDKRSWDNGDAIDDDHAETPASKRSKVATNAAAHNLMKGFASPMLGNNGQELEIEGQFTCDQCDKAFSKQSSLARHKYEHSGQRPHKCDECPKAFKHKHHLTEHKRLHSGEKPFQCGKCLKRFSHSGSYSQHMNHRYSYCKPYRE